MKKWHKTLGKDTITGFYFVLPKLIHIFVVENGYDMKDVLLTILLCLFAIEVPADSWDE